ncbi:glycosyltransferase [Saxibacter everestensis]|uniref:D-inositol 3-phosphate glycosyltransferase n=1 Tax=Saxibacter everestensis TaxID=2909229 RepID=A0ABY8QWS1_9MICO|nr:glycosyltransferase [Brevibacteriaceae bacterium ZFBP1038]
MFPQQSSEPLRIVIGAETYAPEVNGAARFAQRLATGLAQHGHEVHVICPAATGTVSDTEEDGVIVHRLRSHRWYPHPTWQICFPWETKPAVQALLEEIQPDVVHVQAHFVIGRFLIKGAKRRGIPLAATNHFMPDNVAPYVSVPKPILDAGIRWAWRDLRKQFQKADVITTPTQLAADLLTEHGFNHEIRAISCGIDLSGFTPATVDTSAAAKDKDARTVLFVGRLAEEKHVDQIIKAVALTDPALNVRAEIVGSGEQLENLENLARSLGVANRVSFLGKISDEELAKAYARCTLFCLPGTAELQSIATLEAMATGKPVVLADAVALPHLVREGYNGYLFTPGVTVELAEQISKIAALDADALAAMGEASATMVAKHDIGNTLKSFEEIYRSIPAGHRR